MEMPTCRTCGLLAFRKPGVGWIAVGPEDRDNRERRSFDSHYGCFGLKADLVMDGIKFTNNDMDAQTRADGWNYVVDMERPECRGDFVQYRHGFDPKEHAEMLDRQRLIEFQAKQETERRKWEEEEARRNRQLQAHLAGQADAIQAQMAEATRDAARWQFWALVVGSVGIVVAAAIGAWAIREDSPPVNNNDNSPVVVVPTQPPQSTPDTATPPPTQAE